MLSSLVHILFVILLVYFALSVAYLFVFSLMGKWFYRSRWKMNPIPSKRIAILVPAYREDGIILSTARNLLQLDYPRHLYDIYLLADSFESSTLIQLRQLPLETIEVHFDKSTKTKSLNEGSGKSQNLMTSR